MTQFVDGWLTCRLIRSITSICPDLPTTQFYFRGISCGLLLKGPDRFYFFEGCLNRQWPIHDPCGNGTTNNLKDRWPEGQIWVR